MLRMTALALLLAGCPTGSANCELAEALDKTILRCVEENGLVLTGEPTVECQCQEIEECWIDIEPAFWRVGQREFNSLAEAQANACAVVAVVNELN